MSLAKKGKIILFSLIIFSGLFLFLKPVNAVIGTGIFDWSTAVLDALDFVDQAILRFLTKLIIYAFVTSGFVVLAAALLEWAFQLPLYLNNPTVLGGWNFVLGLVNLFFILAIILIALAHILRIETFQLKKTLPRLIIVILLVNFSMLIVGLFADVAQFFMNTFLDSFGTDFVSTAIIPLKQNLGIITNVIIITITAYVAASFTVFGAPISLAIILFQVFQGNLLGNIFAIITLIILNLVMGAIFLVYAVLFIVRIAALWILAIFAPLAFFALVFDQTRKYALSWFKAVFEWAFLGVVAFFLLGLIMSLFTNAFLSRPGEINISAVAGMPSFQLPPSVYNYLFLIIFLVVAFYGSIKFVPVGAQQVIGVMKGQLAAIGGVAGVTKLMTRGVKGAARRAVPEKYRKTARQWAATPTRTAEGKLIPTGKLIREEMEEKGKLRGLARVFGSPYVKRRAGEALLSATTDADRDVFHQTEKEAMGQDVTANMFGFRETSDPPKQAAYMSAMIKKDQMKDATSEKLFGKGNTLLDQKRETEAAYLSASRMGLKDLKEGIERNFVKTVGGERFKQIARDEDLYTAKDEEKDKKKGFSSYVDKIMGEAKEAGKIKELEKGWWEKEDLMEAAHKLWGGHQISEAARTFGKEFTDYFQSNAKPISWYFAYDPKTGNLKNPGLPRYLASSAAASLGMLPLERGETTKDINEYLIRARKKMKEEKEKGRGGSRTSPA